MWAPSAHELAALEAQVQGMAQQLQRQQQQWQSFVAAAQTRLPASSPLKAIDSNASGSVAWQSHAFDRGPHTPKAQQERASGLQQPRASPAAAMKAQLNYLQSEVQRVIDSAVQMQHGSLAEAPAS